MIKINLLPAHILERQRIRSVAILAVVVIVIEAAVLGLVMMRVKQRLADRKIELEYWQGRAATVGQFDTAIKNTQSQLVFYGRWLFWKGGIEGYHNAWAEMLAESAKWIYAKVQVDTLSPSPTQLQIQGRTDSLTSFRRAYLNIIRSNLWLPNVTFQVSGVPGGWQQPQLGGPAQPGVARVAAPGAVSFAGGFRMGFGGRRAGGAAAPVAGAAFGARPTPGAAAGAANPLPVAVTFTCIVKPEYGRRLNPPAPPMGAAPAQGAGAAPGMATGGFRMGFGRPRGRGGAGAAP